MIKINSRKFHFSKRDIQKIKRLRKENMSMDEIAKQFKLKSAMAIYSLCKKHGISTKSTLYYDHDKIDKKIIKLYKEGKSSRDIEKIIGLNQGSVLDVLRNNNIERREPGYFNWDRTYTINENFFEVIDSADKAYILGLLYTDGCNGYDINTKMQSVGLGLHSKDEYLLHGINKILGSDRPLEKSRKRFRQLNLSSKKICEDLIRLGCPPRKSLIIQFPVEEQVPDSLLPHFIRGLIDGDGWASFKHNRRLGIGIGVCSASRRFIVSLYYHLKYLYNIDGLVSLEQKRRNPKHVNMHRITIDRKEDVKKLYDLCYNNNCIAMKRKKENIEECLRRNKEYYDNYKPVVMLIDDIPHKRCYVCKKYKPLDDINFRNNNYKKDGYSCGCRKCEAKRDSEYYHRKQAEKKEKLKCLGS